MLMSLWVLSFSHSCCLHFTLLISVVRVITPGYLEIKQWLEGVLIAVVLVFLDNVESFVSIRTTKVQDSIATIDTPITFTNCSVHTR